MSQYVEFRQIPRPEGRKTDIWDVFSTAGVSLGRVSFWGAWRKFVFAPEAHTVYDPACLRDIADFCAIETDNWRSGARKAP